MSSSIQGAASKPAANFCSTGRSSASFRKFTAGLKKVKDSLTRPQFLLCFAAITTLGSMLAAGMGLACTALTIITPFLIIPAGALAITSLALMVLATGGYIGFALKQIPNEPSLVPAPKEDKK